MTTSLLPRRPVRSFRRAAAAAALGLSGWAIAACGVQSAPAAVAPPAVPATARAAAPGSIDRYLTVAEQLWSTELSGPAAQRELGHVTDDRQLRALLRSGSDAAMRSYVTSRFRSQWFPNEHMSRLRILRAGHAPLDLGVTWVMGPMLQRTLSGAGSPAPTVQVSVQDVIGFVRAMHNKHPAVQVVVRDASGARAVSLLGPAARATLPASGFATIDGTRYAVRSFDRSSVAQGADPVTVWVLLPV